jgi:hypothetical protein
MSSQKNNTSNSSDLKTDSVPDAPRGGEDNDDQENDASLLLPPKEDIINEERETSEINHKTYLKPPKDPSFPKKKKSSPKSVPKSPKNKKENKKFSGMYCLLIIKPAGSHH